MRGKITVILTTSESLKADLFFALRKVLQVGNYVFIKRLVKRKRNNCDMYFLNPYYDEIL